LICCIFFPKDELKEIAKLNGFIQRESAIDGFNFLLTFTTGLMNTTDSTLAQMASFLNNTCHLGVSPQAIDKRINPKAKDFLKHCLDKALRLSNKKIDIPNKLVSLFKHIYIIDSTNFDLHPSLKDIFKGSRGTASDSSMRIQFIYDYLTGKSYIEIGDNRTADSTTLFNIVKENKLETDGNALFLQDLGYSKRQTFVLMNDAHNFFISKLKYNVHVFDLSGNKIDLFKILKKNPQYLNMTIKIDSMECRLVGSKLPESVINQRNRKANKDSKKKKGATSKKEYKLFLSYGLFITNLSEHYSADAIYTIYRLRWQIELVFKSWKSIIGINKIHTARVDRVLCEVYGKLIVAVILSTLFLRLKYRFQKDFSCYKIFQLVKSIALKWAICIHESQRIHAEFIDNLIPQIIRFCKKNKQLNKPTIDVLLSLLQPAEPPNIIGFAA